MDSNQDSFSNKLVALLKNKDFRDIVDKFNANEEDSLNLRKVNTELETAFLKKGKKI